MQNVKQTRDFLVTGFNNYIIIVVELLKASKLSHYSDIKFICLQIITETKLTLEVASPWLDHVF